MQKMIEKSYFLFKELSENHCFTTISTRNIIAYWF